MTASRAILGSVLVSLLLTAAAAAESPPSDLLASPPSEPAAPTPSDLAASPPPATLEDLLTATAVEAADAPPDFGVEKRRASMRLAARAHAARGGLARRGWEIERLLMRQADRLGRIYAFEALLVRRDGFLLAPPVLAETRDAVRFAPGGARATAAARVLRLVRPARLVSAVPGWRDYLARAWPAPAPVARVLLPRSPAERALWRRWTREGWAAGQSLADEILERDLERLNRDFVGMTLWWRLEREGLVGAPTLAADRTAAAGHERLLRIGERSVRIEAGAGFALAPHGWRPSLLDRDGGTGEGGP